MMKSNHVFIVGKSLIQKFIFKKIFDGNIKNINLNLYEIGKSFFQKLKKIRNNSKQFI